MIIKKHYVEENESGAYFTAYLLENSKELLPGKKRTVVVIAPGGGHGLALANEVTANSEEQIDPDCEIWFELAVKWLKKHIPL